MNHPQHLRCTPNNQPPHTTAPKPHPPGTTPSKHRPINHPRACAEVGRRPRPPRLSHALAPAHATLPHTPHAPTHATLPHTPHAPTQAARAPTQAARGWVAQIGWSTGGQRVVKSAAGPRVEAWRWSPRAAQQAPHGGAFGLGGRGGTANIEWCGHRVVRGAAARGSPHLTHTHTTADPVRTTTADPVGPTRGGETDPVGPTTLGRRDSGGGPWAARALVKRHGPAGPLETVWGPARAGVAVTA